MQPAADDPFDVVRAQVARALALAERSHQKWSEVRRRKPVRTQEVAAAHVSLVSALEEVEGDLGELEQCVALVERERARFAALDDAEVASRRTFVNSSRRACDSIRADLEQNGPKLKGAERGRGAQPGERVGLLAAAEGPPASSSRAAARAAADAALFDQHDQLQQSQVAQQEETLEELGSAVGRLKNLGNVMNEEIQSQNRMIVDLEAQVDNAAGAMSALKGRMREMAQSKDRGKFCAIGVLSVLLVVLFMMVLE